jgi:hypothetical protein
MAVLSGMVIDARRKKKGYSAFLVNPDYQHRRKPRSINGLQHCLGGDVGSCFK